MKFTFRTMLAVAALSMLSVGSATAADPAPVQEVQLSDFTPFGVTPAANLETLGCKVFQDDLYDCKAFPEKNAAFSSYTVETRSGHRDGICNVTAYSQPFRGDRYGNQVIKAYEKIGVLLSRKYGPASKTVASGPNTGADLGYETGEQFAAALKAGVKQHSKEWSDLPGVLPYGTSIKLTMVAVSEEKTFVELNYFLGGPGCSTEADQAFKGL